MPSKDTQFKKGTAPGRPKGTPNKLTKSVKETVLKVFTELQLDKKHNLKAFAKKYPRDFYNIAAKLIPTEIAARVEGSITWNETKTYEVKPETNEGA